jgi:hypothetical protein
MSFFEILTMVIVCLQIVLWLCWLMLFAHQSETTTFARVGLSFLVGVSAIPVSFLVTFAVTSHALWYGLGCTVSSFQDSATLVGFDSSPISQDPALTEFQTFVIIWCGNGVFKVDRPVHLICLCLFGFTALALAMVAAGRENLEVGLILAGIGGTYVQFVCSWWAKGSKAKILQMLSSIVFAAVVLTPLVDYVVALLRDDIPRPGQAPRV